MKKYILSFALGLMSLTAFAQADYEKIMTEKVAKLKPVKPRRISRPCLMTFRE